MIPLALALTALAADPCGPACGEEPACARARAACLVEAGEARAAVETLKPAWAAHPDQPDLLHRLALAYRAGGNHAWAARRLLERVAADPDDLETRTLAAWLLLDQGDRLRAAPLLADDPVGASDASLVVRHRLLHAALAHLQGDEALAAARLRLVARDPTGRYPGDAALERQLRAAVLGDPGRPWSGRLWLLGGYGTNVTETSPQAEGAEGHAGSALLGLDAVGRYEPWAGPVARPRAEARLKLQWPTAALPAAYVDLTARVGAELGPAEGARGRLLYSFELLGDAGSDAFSGGPGRLFMEAHRVEAEADLPGGVQLFAGGGRRVYRRVDRTRTELDGGAAFSRGWGGWHLTGIGTARWQRARHPDWDLVGATGLIRLVAPLPSGARVEGRAMLLRNVYPRHALERRDWTARAQIGPWTPDLDGWRVGLSYGVGQRWSSGKWAAGADPYSWSRPDHRVLIEVRGEGSRGGPRRADLPEPRVGLPVDVGGEASGLDRVQDLLRREDSARRGSSCVD